MNRWYSISSCSVKTFSNDIFSLNPEWITGFTDGEGCFSVQITKSSSPNPGFTVKPYFSISLHKKDQEIIDFKDFCSVSSLMKEKKHLTALGLKKIRGIKENMNKDRRS